MKSFTKHILTQVSETGNGSGEVKLLQAPEFLNTLYYGNKIF